MQTPYTCASCPHTATSQFSNVQHRIQQCLDRACASLHVVMSLPTRGWGSRYKLPWPGYPEGVPGPDYVAYVFVFLGRSVFFDCTT